MDSAEATLAVAVEKASQTVAQGLGRGKDSLGRDGLSASWPVPRHFGHQRTVARTDRSDPL